MVGLFWGFRRANRGKKFGNEIADSMPINRKLFHTAVVESGANAHLITLAELKDRGLSVVDARNLFLYPLAMGLENLENQYGKQRLIDEAKPIVLELLEEFEREMEDDCEPKQAGVKKQSISDATPKKAEVKVRRFFDDDDEYR